MEKKKNIYLVIILVLAAAVYFLKPAGNASDKESFRTITQLIYSKHARCRMGCRDITEGEIRKVIKEGTLNQEKSGYDKKYRDQTYALEGYGDNDQYIRVVVTPRQNELLIITVIDLRKQWQCDCN